MTSSFPLNPSSVNAAEVFNRAIAHHQAGKFVEAEQLYRQILQQQPQNADALAMMGVICCQRGNLEQGIALYRQVLTIRPEHRQARENLNLALWKQGKRLMDEAIANFNLSINFAPADVQTHNVLAGIYLEQGLYEPAIALYQQSLAVNPGNIIALNGIGTTLQLQGKSSFAVHFYQQALALQPDNLDNLIGLSKAKLDQGNLDEALSLINRALVLSPNHAIARYNRALMLIQQGNFQEGFAEYEWRFRTGEFPPCPFKQPVWNGKPLAGRTLLLHAEQGLGDTLQFIRYAAIATQSGGRVIFTCHRPLIRLLSTLPGIAEFIPLGLPLPAFDVYAPLMSLPAILGTTLETVPHSVPYIHPPASDWQLPIATSSSNNNPQILKVGIVWAGGSLYKQNYRRSLSLKQFDPVLDVSNIALYSLQKGIPQVEIAELGWDSRLQDLNHHLNDMADTATAIAQLDLIITVDTSVAHLAGAMGKPVWLLLSRVADWRWMSDRDDTPWYPTMRLFRQHQPGDWQELMQRVAEELKDQRDQRLG
ncbi:glycosyltransferase family protein [Phormidium sp. CLA17]|uniref:tetratricopeptide repeat-containing glycosyltransferase family protein n=1 Tax=Leptolyngbya sp. Cla-17 TaxID=2803751 RepID=UPI00149121B4|nr:tetratricopeptide repeat-containing glycosyltransferase family protein [Leptolyngbya sp. Cla-17]MBM0741865.1 glycosyltransferase family protein [Leptolyngbya sp. Cla-17]